MRKNCPSLACCKRTSPIIEARIACEKKAEGRQRFSIMIISTLATQQHQMWTNKRELLPALRQSLRIMGNHKLPSIAATHLKKDAFS